MKFLCKFTFKHIPCGKTLPGKNQDARLQKFYLDLFFVLFYVFFHKHSQSISGQQRKRIACNVVPAPPFLRHPPLGLACPLFKVFVSAPDFSVPPSFKVF